MGAFAWGRGGVGKRLDTPRRLARCRSAYFRASHSTEEPEEEVFKEAAVGQEKPGVPFPQGSRGPGEGLPRLRLRARRQQRRPGLWYPFPGALVRPARATGWRRPPPPGRLPRTAGRPAGSLASSLGARPKVGKVRASVVLPHSRALLRGDSGSLFLCSSALTTRRTMIAGTLLLEEWYLSNYMV